MVGLETGQEFAGHRIEGIVGRGGMGVVYRATEIDLGRLVALKLIAPELAGDPSFRTRFERECRTAASIDHPNVIPIFDAGEEDGLLYLTMRYVPGTDLAEIVAKEGPLDPGRAAAIIDQMGAALDAAHEDGLVHRDIKPGNTLVTSTRGREHVYLTDFGLTKSTAQTGGLTRSGTVVGTPDYMAPEQWDGRGSIDARADVYSLGCVLHELLTGKIPFERDSDPQKMYAHLSDAPPPVTELRPELPRELDEVVARALSKNAGDRYPSAGDLGRAALAAARGKEAHEAERTVATGRAAPTRVAAAPAVTRDAATAEAATGGAAAPDAPTAAGSSGDRWRRWKFIAAGAAVFAVGIAAIGLITNGLSDGGGSPEPQPPDNGSNITPNDNPQDPPIVTSPPPTNDRPVTAPQVGDTLSAYATAYTDEDLAAMSSLLTPDFTRSSTDGPTQDKGDALAEYAKQFAQLDDPEYVLTGIRATGGDTEGFANARYLITDKGEDAGAGEITFHVERGGKLLQIDKIEVRPDS